MLQKKRFGVFPLSFKDLLGNIMPSKQDLRTYFVKADNTNKETSSRSQKVSLVIQFSSSQVKRRSNTFNRKSRNKLLNPLNTTIIFHPK